jgi:hypothetical protein
MSDRARIIKFKEWSSEIANICSEVCDLRNAKIVHSSDVTYLQLPKNASVDEILKKVNAYRCQVATIFKV